MKKVAIPVLMVLLLASCGETDKKKNVTGDADTMVLQNGANMSAAKKEYTNWRQVDFTSPIIKYDEIKSNDIEVREGNSMSIFSIDENILFDFNKAELRSEGKEKLDEIAASIKKRYPDGRIGIYGYTDSIGSKDYNKQLAEERANAVKQYLQQQTGLDMSRINTYAKGESNPVATNATPAGRQKNRRVDIVAQNDSQ